jgi:glucan 1,3-beta-glucosidase
MYYCIVLKMLLMCFSGAKIGNSSITGIPTAPMWSYQLGLENGWIPLDPRDALGTCQSLNSPFAVNFTGPYPAWQTGGAGAGTLEPMATSTIEVYPPTLSNAMGANPTLLPYYTDISANPTLPATTFTAATASIGNGWADPQDTALAPAPISGCVYPDAWNAPAASTAFICSSTLITSTPLLV